MTTRKINEFEHIRTNPTLWQYWGHWGSQPMLFVSPWSEAMQSQTMKDLGIDISGSMKTIHDHFYFLKQDIAEVCRVTNHGGSSLYQAYFDQCEKTIAQFDAADTDIQTLIERLIVTMTYSVLTEICDTCLSEKIKGLCTRENISFADVFAQMTPDQKTLLMQYQEELKDVDENTIDTFVERWKWVGTHAFEGEALTKEKVQEVKRDIEQNQSLSSKQDDLQIKNEELKIYIQIGKKLAYYRSQLMDVMNKNIYRYRQSLNKFAQHYGLTYDDVISLTHNEIRGLIDGTASIPNDLSQREKHFAYISINGQEKVLSGDDVEKELELHSEKQEARDTIEGTIANKGIARGKVVVVKKVADCEKVKSGDILVAPETTPDYIFAMRRAAAFVTNQGGITSHAAIISRELGVPCVIGTEYATEILHDGDEVEVDANNGVIKKV